MTREEFISLIGQDIVVDYPFGDELQQWSMKNFYIDDEGKELSENIILRGKVDSEYTSSEKEFEYYELIEVKGNKTGKYTLDNQEVIYIYSFVGGMGGDIIDPAFPKTGVEDSNLPEVIFSLSSLLLAGTILLKKKFN